MQTVKNLLIGLVLIVVFFGVNKYTTYKAEVRNLGGIENHKAMQERLSSPQYSDYQKVMLQSQVSQIVTALYGTGK